MTYRKKAEQIIRVKLGVNSWTAERIVELMVKDDYIPRAIPALQAPEELEDWDVEMPNSNI